MHRRPVDENRKNKARVALQPFHQDLFELYGDHWPYHSEFARILNEVARGQHTAKEAVRLSRQRKAA